MFFFVGRRGSICINNATNAHTTKNREVIYFRPRPMPILFVTLELPVYGRPLGDRYFFGNKKWCEFKIQNWKRLQDTLHIECSIGRVRKITFGRVDLAKVRSTFLWPISFKRLVFEKYFEISFTKIDFFHSLYEHFLEKDIYFSINSIFHLTESIFCFKCKFKNNFVFFFHSSYRVKSLDNWVKRQT